MRSAPAPTFTTAPTQGDGGETIKRIRDGRARPSRQLAEVFEQMVLGNSEFTLIEEQKVVYERALQFARKLRPGKRTVLLVRGGPGTGKSVVAIHLMAAMLQKGLNIRYVSKNAAARTVFKAKLTGQRRRTRFDNLSCGSGAFVDCPPGFYDALVVDEAHRLNRFSGLYGNQGENQPACGDPPGQRQQPRPAGGRLLLELGLETQPGSQRHRDPRTRLRRPLEPGLGGQLVDPQSHRRLGGGHP